MRLVRGTQLMFYGGEYVRERDGRHIGRVIAQFNSTVRVQWENGTKQDFTMEERENLVKVHPSEL